MRADIFTKPFTDKVKWSHACTQIAHVYIDPQIQNKHNAAAAAPVVNAPASETKPIASNAATIAAPAAKTPTT